MNNLILFLNWILNWMVFERYSMFEWIIKNLSPELGSSVHLDMIFFFTVKDTRWPLLHWEIQALPNIMIFGKPHASIQHHHHHGPNHHRVTFIKLSESVLVVKGYFGSLQLQLCCSPELTATVISTTLDLSDMYYGHSGHFWSYRWHS